MDKKSMDRLLGSEFKGFTLVEILIAMAVASIGLMSLAHLQCTAIKGNTLGGTYTQATFLAENIVERLKNGDMVKQGAFGLSDRLGSESRVVQDAGVLFGISESGDVGGRFNVQWQVDTHTQWARLISVTVSWKSVLGKTRSLRLVSSSRGNGN